MGLSRDTWIRVNRGIEPNDRRAITPCFDLAQAQGESAACRRRWFWNVVFLVVLFVGATSSMWGGK
jgi:hypothetical protein